MDTIQIWLPSIGIDLPEDNRIFHQGKEDKEHTGKQPDLMSSNRNVISHFNSMFCVSWFFLENQTKANFFGKPNHSVIHLCCSNIIQ